MVMKGNMEGENEATCFFPQPFILPWRSRSQVIRPITYSWLQYFLFMGLTNPPSPACVKEDIRRGEGLGRTLVHPSLGLGYSLIHPSFGLILIPS